jgi:hypothetical protein
MTPHMPGPAHAVAVAYLVTLYGGGGVARAQTMAVVTWLLGHMLLALNLRFEREPLSRRALVSNRLMLLWGGVALLTALLTTVVPWAGVLVVDEHDPLRLLYRSSAPILTPETAEEIDGVVPNVVFPSGRRRPQEWPGGRLLWYG